MSPALPTPSLPDAFYLLDYFGLAVFAISGALLAAERCQTLVTFLFFAVVTEVGGGIMRGLLIGAPVFWVHKNLTLAICLAAGLAVWLTARQRWNERCLLWFDVLGLAAYSAYGASKALAYGVAPIPAFVMGVLTACAGGTIHDVLAGGTVDPDASQDIRHRCRAFIGAVRHVDRRRPRRPPRCGDCLRRHLHAARHGHREGAQASWLRGALALFRSAAKSVNRSPWTKNSTASAACPPTCSPK